MRAKKVFEKFVEDSDPIEDLMGYDAKIDAFFRKKYDTKKYWNLFTVKNNKFDILEAIFSRFYNEVPESWVFYLINNISFDEELDRLLRTCVRDIKDKDKIIKYADALIKKGAQFDELVYLAKYVSLGGTLKSLTPEQELVAASYAGNFDDFVDLVESGGLIKISMLNGIFKKEWKYQDFAKKEYDKILNWLRKQNVEDIVHPRDHKKLDRIKSLLSLKKEGEERDYPQGYRIYRILKFINETHPSTRRELVRFIYELNYGKGTFNPVTNSSYYSDGFKPIYSYVYTNDDGKFYLNAKGKERLERYYKKFNHKEKEINPYI